MPRYIKSHSNYVLQDRHQLINDGTIFERDITTIGAVNQFSPGQTPIYRTGNFIISIRDDGGTANQYNTNKWEKGVSGDVWDINTVSAMTSDDELQDDTKIVLKNDYYDFREFAYYGSLTELFRSSINDILDRFPGELYCVSGNGEVGGVYYTSGYTQDFERIEDSVRLGGDDYYEVSNPYGINIHTTKITSDVKPLKYFANEGYKNYEIIVGNQETGTEITSWTSTPSTSCATIGDLVATVTINNSYTLYAYVGEGGDIVYLHKSNENDIHIRPKKDFIAEFYNECNDLQRLMLNPDTSPKYKATFSVIRMNDYGYYRELEDFIYPTSEGDYNPSADGEYINRLVEIGEFYDEYLTDNLYRSMTHEAIKNFDWSYTKDTDEDEEHFQGGQKIQKALRIFAREFDEQKKYIDNIKNTGRLTYDGRGNIPDYFLTDICEDDGWDIESIIPYTLDNWKKFSADTSNILSNVSGTTNHQYLQSSKPTVIPYSKEYIGDGTEDGYFLECNEDSFGISGCLYDWYPGGGDCESGSVMSVRPAGGENMTYLETCDSSSRIEYKIKSYTDSANTFTYMDLNNEFLRRLKLNSRYLWRHKGTLEGIEMMLGMFGLKSKRWLCKNDSCRYQSYRANTCGDEGCNNTIPDYEIIEYTQFTSPIVDEWDSNKQMFKIDWINSTKTITYDYRSMSNYTLPGNMGAYYAPYQGLPVAYEDRNGRRYLYPKFNKDEQIDGNPYFQMDGGWLSKTINGIQNFQFDVDDYIVHIPVENNPRFESGFTLDNHKLYKETVRSIKRVDDLKELLSQPQSELYDGIICYVGNVDEDVAVIDGDAFPIEYEYINNSVKKSFVRFTRQGGFIKVGGLYFDESIVVYNSSYEQATYSIDDKLDGYEVKAYINGNSFVCKSGENDYYSIHSFNIIGTDSNDTYSNYFKLTDVVYSDMITYEAQGDGWKRLKYNSSDYIKINTIHNYYEGNNPHNGNLRYDSGHEYFTYFQRIFKYAEDNGLFDTRCYGEGYDSLEEKLNPDGIPIGFSNLICSAETVLDYDKYLSADTKVHYFGNYRTINGTVKKYGNDYQIESGCTTGRICIDNEIQPWQSDDPVTNQIVNNKRIKIKFNMKNDFASQEGQEELKYIDEIVMNYLTQMLPSTVIVEAEYNFCDFDNTDC